MSEAIPQDPSRAEYRQGKTLGTPYRHWRRARIGRRLRLFFRYDSKAKVIVHAWMNDERTLRSSGSKADPYTVFAGMLAQGSPPRRLGLVDHGFKAESATRKVTAPRAGSTSPSQSGSDSSPRRAPTRVPRCRPSPQRSRATGARISEVLAIRAGDADLKVDHDGEMCAP